MQTIEEVVRMWLDGLISADEAMGTITSILRSQGGLK